MRVLTWNLNKSSTALRTLLAHVPSFQEPTICALQEVPGDYRAQLQQSHTIFHAINLPSVDSSVQLLGTIDVRVHPNGRRAQLAGGRMEAVEVTAPGAPNLSVVGVHGPDLVNNSTERDRAGWGLVVATELEQFWTSGPLVVLGDFNADPWSVEMTSRSGFFACREPDWEVTKRKTFAMRFSSKKRRPMKNPMWDLVTKTGPGSATFRKRNDVDVFHHLIDQILLSKELNMSRVEVLTKLDGLSLCRSDGSLRPGFSDHLPVTASLV